MTIKAHKKSAATLSCSRRTRLGTDACINSRAMPKQVLEDCRVRTTLHAVERAFKNQELSASGIRLIEIEGDLNMISNQISRLADTLTTVGLIPEIREKLEELTEKRQKLEAEKLLINRTDSALDLEGVVDVERELLDTDTQKLNSLLQSVGYKLECDVKGRVFYQNELICEYKRYDRKTNQYVYVIDGDEVRKYDHFRNKEAVQQMREIQKSAPEPTPEDSGQTILFKLLARNVALPND